MPVTGSAVFIYRAIQVKDTGEIYKIGLMSAVKKNKKKVKANLHEILVLLFGAIVLILIFIKIVFL
jgi:hypothetical protein